MPAPIPNAARLPWDGRIAEPPRPPTLSEQLGLPDYSEWRDHVFDYHGDALGIYALVAVHMAIALFVAARRGIAMPLLLYAASAVASLLVALRCYPWVFGEDEQLFSYNALFGFALFVVLMAAAQHFGRKRAARQSSPAR